jgi:hypothetical protein
VDAGETEPVGGRLTDHIGIGVLTRLVHRDLVDEVLASTGKTEARVRRLPARVVVYFVLALTLFFGEDYQEVMRKLVNGLLYGRSWRRDWTMPTKSALCQARTRLGEAPLRELFDRVAVPMATRATMGAVMGRWRLMAIDGTLLDVPDTPDNHAAFGRPGGGPDSRAKTAAFPQLRIVGIGECGTHAIVAAQWGGWRDSERALAEHVLSALEPGMLLIADRGFYSRALWQRAAATGAELLWRMSASVDLPVLQVYPDGSYRSELTTATQRQKRRAARDRGGPPAEHGIPVRVVEYEIDNRGGQKELIVLVTTIFDLDLAPALDLAKAYHQRWEFENLLDEMKTHQRGGPGTILRSRSPELVRQEARALLITHYAIRDLMRQAADDIDLDPDELSFISSLRLVRRHVANQAAFSPSPTG